MIKTSIKVISVIFAVLLLGSCEREDVVDNGCKNIDEVKSLSWAKNGGQTIDISGLLSTNEGPDGNDYVRCRFLVECDDVCPDSPVNVEINYEYDNTFPDGSDYDITDLKLEALFWEYSWNPESSIIVTEKRTVPMSFLEPGIGLAQGEFEVAGPYKDGQDYAHIATTLDFTFRIQNPDEPDAPAEVLETIISKVNIEISYMK